MPRRTLAEVTMYPLPAVMTRDFKNLMDVYLDAVFNLEYLQTEEIFLREGWHYELKSPEEELDLQTVSYTMR